MSLSTARLAADPEGSRCVPRERGSREDCQQSPRGADCGCARVCTGMHADTRPLVASVVREQHTRIEGFIPS